MLIHFPFTCPLRYVNSEDIRETGYTYVMPKNILKTFICISVAWSRGSFVTGSRRTRREEFFEFGLFRTCWQKSTYVLKK